MTTTDATHWSVYAVTLLTAWMADNWVDISVVVFGAIHLLIAVDNWMYKRSLRNKPESENLAGGE